LEGPLVLDAVCAGMVGWDSSRDRDFPETVGRRFRGMNGAASAPPRPTERRLYGRTRRKQRNLPSIGVRLGALPTPGLPELPSPPLAIPGDGPQRQFRVRPTCKRKTQAMTGTAFRPRRRGG